MCCKLLAFADHPAQRVPLSLVLQQREQQRLHVKLGVMPEQATKRTRSKPSIQRPSTLPKLIFDVSSCQIPYDGSNLICTQLHA
jgi:hypothetical protein